MSKPKIALIEVFRSVQGEGYHTGRDAVFVRLTGCSLACEFAPGVVCDTPYQQAKLKVTLDELFEELIRPLLHTHDPLWRQQQQAKQRDYLHVPMLIITGGEPTDAPMFDALVDAGNAAGFYTAVETNGMFYRKGLEWVNWLSISPKIFIPQTSAAPQHNQNPSKPTLDPEVLRVAAHYPSEYRFVIGGKAIDNWPQYYTASKHYVSPAVLSDGSGDEWKNGKGFPGFAPGAVERCLQIVKADPRWRISVQTHKFLEVR